MHPWKAMFSQQSIEIVFLFIHRNSLIVNETNSFTATLLSPAVSFLFSQFHRSSLGHQSELHLNISPGAHSDSDLRDKSAKQAHRLINA